MPVYRNTKRDAKRLSSTAQKGDWLYVVEEVSQRVAPYEDPRLCARYKVTHTHWPLGGAMVGSKSVEQLLAEHGTVYTEQPRGVRGIWEPSPQVGGPLGNDEAFGRPLDKDEIRGLRKRVRENLAGQKDAKRKGWI